jgi:hypothetical protein
MSQVSGEHALVLAGDRLPVGVIAKCPVSGFGVRREKAPLSSGNVGLTRASLKSLLPRRCELTRISYIPIVTKPLICFAVAACLALATALLAGSASANQGDMESGLCHTSENALMCFNDPGLLSRRLSGDPAKKVDYVNGFISSPPRLCAL